MGKLIEPLPPFSVQSLAIKVLILYVSYAWQEYDWVHVQVATTDVYNKKQKEYSCKLEVF